jgi:hypothetical protein
MLRGGCLCASARSLIITDTLEFQRENRLVTANRDAFDEISGLLTEQRNPRTIDLDRLGVRELLERLNAEDRLVPDAVAAEIPWIERAVALVVAAFRRGGRLIYAGAGTSGRLGVLDAVECPPTFGTPPAMIQGVVAGGSPALTRAVEGAEDRDDEAARCWPPSRSVPTTWCWPSPPVAGPPGPWPRSTRPGSAAPGPSS